jgi:hypothetical protein
LRAGGPVGGETDNELQSQELRKGEGMRAREEEERRRGKEEDEEEEREEG